MKFFAYQDRRRISLQRKSGLKPCCCVQSPKTHGAGRIRLAIVSCPAHEAAAQNSLQNRAEQSTAHTMCAEEDHIVAGYRILRNGMSTQQYVLDTVPTTSQRRFEYEGSNSLGEVPRIVLVLHAPRQAEVTKFQVAVLRKGEERSGGGSGGGSDAGQQMEWAI